MTRTRIYGLFILAALLFCVYTFTNAGRLHIIDEASLFAVTESVGQRAAVDTNAIAWTQWVNSPGEVLGAFGEDGTVYSKKGPAPAFVAVPWYLALRLLTRLGIEFGLLQGALLWNGVVTAFTASLLWLTAVRLGYRDRTSMWLGLIFGLATIAWPYATQYFGEPLSAFSLLLCFYGMLSWKMSGRWGWMAAAGVGAGLAIATVTAHSILIAVLVGYAAVSALLLFRAAEDGRMRTLLLGALAFVVPILIAVGLLGIYNQVRFGSPLSTGYHFDTGEGFTNPVLSGLWGLLFSPYRSVFLHTPVFIISLAAFVPFVRRARLEGIVIAVMTLCLVLLYSAWWMWWGGYAWGPRFLVPMTPFWVLLLAPLVQGFRLSAREHEGIDWRRAASWTLLVVGSISFVVQIAAVSLNFVNYETLLRSEFFPTNWDNPLEFGPPAQKITDLLLSPVIGQFRLLARGGLRGNSDLPWLWPDGAILWTLLFVCLAAIITLSWQLRRWQVVARSPSASLDVPSAPMVALTLLIPGIVTAAWLGGVSGDPTYGKDGVAYRAIIDDLCASEQATDSIVTVAPFSYHIGMNWLGSHCGHALPVYGYAQNSLDYPQTEPVLTRALADSDRIWLITQGVAPNAPENQIERWLADHAYKADDRWFDDYRAVRYATPRALDGVRQTTHSLFLTDGEASRISILNSIVPSKAQPGDIIPIDIGYFLHSAPSADLRWFVQLLSPDGVAVAQIDTAPNANYSSFTSLPVNVPLRERAALQLPDDLPPGNYQVIAGLYNPAAPGGSRLRAADSREFLVLTSLEVTE